jgi:hypothetical protein
MSFVSGKNRLHIPYHGVPHTHSVMHRFPRPFRGRNDWRRTDEDDWCDQEDAQPVLERELRHVCCIIAAHANMKEDADGDKQASNG